MAPGTASKVARLNYTSSRDAAYAFSTTSKPDSLANLLVSKTVVYIEAPRPEAAVEQLQLSPDDFKLFEQVLENPPAPNQALVRLFELHPKERDM